MYLTSVPLHDRAFAGRSVLADRRVLHRRVMSLFGDLGHDERSRERGGVLFRVEAGEGRVLVQSAQPPAPREGVRSVDAAALLTLPEGLDVRFAVHVNAVKTINVGDPAAPRTARGPVSDEELEGFVAGKLRGLDRVEVVMVAREAARQGRTPLAIAAVEGVARVADPQVVGEMLRSGVGKGRAYGCGLVTVARAG